MTFDEFMAEGQLLGVCFSPELRDAWNASRVATFDECVRLLEENVKDWWPNPSDWLKKQAKKCLE